MVAMTACRRGFECELQYAARLQRVDHRVHVPSRCSIAHIEPAVVAGTGLRDARLHLRGNGLTCFFVFLYLGTMYCLHRRVAFHHADARGWPCEGEVGIEALAGHRIVSGTRRVIQGYDDL